MIAIGLRFPSGRFHATPWGRHVNEGATEWPPSPWRILRSLVAAWKVRTGELGEAQVRGALQELTSPPAFNLPAATVGHTRHYMRWYKKGPEDQTLVFDAFVCLERGSEVCALWPGADLDEDRRVVLSTLLDRLGYIGRAESWCDGRLLTEEEAKLVVPNCQPVGGAELELKELVRVLCADPDTAFGDEHVKRIGGRGGRGRGERPMYDPCWHLCIETSQLHAEKWSDAPGSKWVTYARAADCFQPQPRATRAQRGSRPKMQVARYALDSSVLPPATETLPIAEQIRWMLMGIYGRIAERDGVKGQSAVFSGKDQEGRPLTDHSHAYYLPADEDGDGRLDHVTVLAEEGFDPDELKALDRLRVLRRGEERPEVNLLLLALGRLDDFQFSVLSRSRHWVSATPFLVTRHPKKNGLKRDPENLLHDAPAFVEEVLREELDRLCRRRGLEWSSEAVEIERLEDPPGVFRIQPSRWAAGAIGPHLRPLEFKRFRSRKRDDDGGRRRSGAFSLSFPEPISGPVCLVLLR